MVTGGRKEEVQKRGSYSEGSKGERKVWLLPGLSKEEEVGEVRGEERHGRKEAREREKGRLWGRRVMEGGVWREERV